jgi:hypothetical protein
VILHHNIKVKQRMLLLLVQEIKSQVVLMIDWKAQDGSILSL